MKDRNLRERTNSRPNQVPDLAFVLLAKASQLRKVK